MIYLISGAFTLFVGPIVGRLSDRFGKFNMFTFGSLFSIVMVLIYTNLGVTPLWVVALINVLMFVGIFSRMIPSQALMSAIPLPESRGSFMSVSSSMQQIAGGIASVFAGLIVVQRGDETLGNFNILGYVMVGVSLIALTLMYQIHKMINEKPVR